MLILTINKSSIAKIDESIIFWNPRGKLLDIYRTIFINWFIFEVKFRNLNLDLQGLQAYLRQYWNHSRRNEGQRLARLVDFRRYRRGMLVSGRALNFGKSVYPSDSCQQLLNDTFTKIFLQK